MVNPLDDSAREKLERTIFLCLARIVSPEALFPAEDQEHMTASIMYNLPLNDGNWANNIVWGRTRSLQDSAIFSSYLLESTLRFRTKNYV